MANRFPLIVNPVSKKIEELVSGDNLDLTGNGLIVSGSTGVSGQYLKSTSTTLVWDNPGDVYLTAAQTITNKTIESSTISGTTNTFTFIPNAALVNNSITVNGVAIVLGGTVTTPDNNTTYSISAQDGGNAATKVIRLTSGGNSGAGVDDDVSLVAGTNVTLSRTGEAITINSSYVDTNTVTRVAASGGTLVSGDITIAASGAASVAQVGSTITVSAVDTNTVTRLRGTAAGTYTSGDLQLLAGGATTVVQSSSDITISSTDTITRVRGAAGTLTSGDITIAAGGSSTVAQVGSTITISSSYVDTITRVRGTTGGTYTSGDLTIAAGGATSVSQSGSTITISSVDTNTTYTAGTAITLTGTTFSLKNNANFTGNRLLKWDSGNSQVTNSIISDDGSAVTIAGDLTVTGATTTVSSQTVVIEDAQIELRKGLSLTGVDAGIQVNRTTNNLGIVSSFNVMQWFESGGYWRTYDGSVANRLVTEGETQTLTNKTLSNPTLTTPTIGAATATTVNGLTISTTVSGVLTIANNKTFTCNNTLTFSGTDASTVGFGTGGTVVYTTNNLSVFGSTTSAQLRGVLSDETGVGVAVFATSPTLTTSILTGSTTFAVFNTTATTINAFGAATTITLGATTGTTTVRNSLQVNGTTNLGDVVGDVINLNGTVDFVNADFTIRGSGANPISIGRGGNAIATNTRIGHNCLESNTSGSQNVAIGYEAAKTINSGASIVAIGYQALTNAGTGQHNIAIGRSALTAILGGQRNVGVGSNTLEGNTIGNNNVAIGYYAGGGATGNGNVLIGPAPDGNNTNVTYTPPTPSGDNQLVIGSGTSTWVRGDNNFDVTLPQNTNVGGNLTISGNLTVNGTTTTINTNVLSVDDKLIDLADVSVRTFAATIVSGSANITAISPVTGLIPGMAVSISTAGLSVPNGTTIVSITSNTAVLSNVVTGSSGSATFVTTGATDTTADGGGIRVKGTTDKSITYTNSLSTWTSTENFDLATGKVYRVGNVQVASGSQIGPSTGSLSLGAGVTTSSLTQVGTLSSLTVSGNLTVDTNTLVVDASNNRVHIGEAGTSQANLNISGTGGQGGGIQINRNTTGNPTSGQSLGSIAFKGVTSANTNAAGEVLIEAIASENHSGSTAGTELAIYTKPTGTGPGSSPTKRLTITSAGLVGIGTAPASGATLHVDAIGGATIRVSRISASAGAYGQIEHDGTNTTLTSTAATVFFNNSNEAVRIDSSRRLLVGTDTATGSAILQVRTPTTYSATVDSAVNFVNTSTKVYPTTASFSVTAGLDKNIELGTAQTIDTVTPGGFNFVTGTNIALTKSAGNIQDIERLYFGGFAQNFTWTDANTCKQYVGFVDRFFYSGFNANSRTSTSFSATEIVLVCPDTRTQTITYVNSQTLRVNPQGTSTVNITQWAGVAPTLSYFNFSAGTHTSSLTNAAFYDTGSFSTWGVQGTTGTLAATITNLYGLRLRPPVGTTGLTITNNWGIYQEWGNANNYFAGNIQMASGKGIDFSANANAAGMTSELLDDYEEGTWTPTFGRSGSDPTVTYPAGAGNRVGTYTKIGNMVYAFWDMTSTAYSGGSGDAWIRGLPFNVSSTQAGYSVVQWRDGSSVPAGAAGTILKGYAQQGQNFIALQYDNSGANGFGTNSSVLNWQTGRTTGYVIYQTDS